jgi:hypothetical protein
MVLANILFFEGLGTFRNGIAKINFRGVGLGHLKLHKKQKIRKQIDAKGHQ